MAAVGYKTLEIWQRAREIVIDIHRMTIEKLPKFETFEVGTQIHRSMKSVKSTIVEGYGRRRYKQEFVRFLVFAQASCDETVDHLETQRETGSLTDEAVFNDFHARLQALGKKLNLFIQAVEKEHRSAQ